MSRCLKGHGPTEADHRQRGTARSRLLEDEGIATSTSLLKNQDHLAQKQIHLVDRRGAHGPTFEAMFDEAPSEDSKQPKETIRFLCTLESCNVRHQSEAALATCVTQFS